uniref:Genome polyprotein n=1 Tax=Arachnidan jingmen-related virus TaxID=2822572 RepID=A0A8A6RQA4_9FLAV|nr:NS3 [Arachnidan jingmen-related virus]
MLKIGGGTSPLLLPIHTFHFLVGSTLFLNLLNAMHLSLVAAILWPMLATKTMLNLTRAQLLLWRLLPLFWLVMGIPSLIPLFAIILQMKNQDLTMPQTIHTLMEFLEKHANTLDTNLHKSASIHGVNSMTMVLDFFGFMRNGTIDDWLAFSPMPVVTATYIRPNGLAPFIEPIMEEHPIPPSECHAFDQEVASTNRTYTTVGVVCLLVLLMNTPMVGIVLIFSVLFAFWDTAVAARINPEVRHIEIRDGVYSITVKWMGLTIDKAIGVGHLGVLHAPYHAVKGNALIMHKQRFEPFFMSAKHDLVTWGGLPQMNQLKPDDYVFINLETENSRSTHVVVPEVSEAEAIYSWIGNSKPGQSGSPIWKKDPDAEGYQLVGLVGRWIKPLGSQDATEYVVMPDIFVENTELGNFQEVTLHPGAGKTRTIIPNKIMAHITSMIRQSKTPKILLAGSTRIVCREMYEALKKKIPLPVGLNMKGSAHLMKRRANIQIAAHQSLVNMMMNSDPIVYKPTMIIVDESHTDNVATKYLVRWTKRLAEVDKVTVVHLSATMKDKFDAKSNYPIHDEKIDPRQCFTKVEECARQGKKVLYFVPGDKGPKGATSVAAQLLEKGIKAIPLSRKNYAVNALRMKDPDVEVIVTTNIAECGFNWDADVVVDTAMEFDYYADDAIIHGDKRKISQASRIQRRGRVGRIKAGEYYFAEYPNEGNYVKASEIDADILETGRDWSDREEAILGMQLTDDQVKRVFNTNESPMFVWMTTNSRGGRLQPHDLGNKMREWLNGNRCYMGCGKDACAGYYSWYDERHHDDLLDLKNGVFQMNAAVKNRPIYEF